MDRLYPPHGTKQTYMDVDALDLGDGARYFFKVTAVDF